MLPEKQKLTRSQFAAGRHTTIRTPYFVIKISPNKLSYPRMGVVVSSAAIKSAVKRNFLKRQAKAIFKESAKGSKDFVVIFSGQAKSSTKTGLQAELQKIFK